jgi:hypothetical protein
MLSGIPAGARVELSLAVDLTVRRIQAAGREFQGVLVKAVDADRNTITIDDDKAPPEVAGITFPVARDAGIVIDGKPGKLAGIPKGAYLNPLTLSVDQKTARGIQAEGSPRVFGEVQAVDPGKNTITVDGKTFSVAKDANMAFDGNTVTLAGIPKGAQVTVLIVCVDQKTARLIHAYRR